MNMNIPRQEQALRSIIEQVRKIQFFHPIRAEDLQSIIAIAEGSLPFLPQNPDRLQAKGFPPKAEEPPAKVSPFRHIQIISFALYTLAMIRAACPDLPVDIMDDVETALSMINEELGLPQD